MEKIWLKINRFEFLLLYICQFTPSNFTSPNADPIRLMPNL